MYNSDLLDIYHVQVQIQRGCNFQVKNVRMYETFEDLSVLKTASRGCTVKHCFCYHCKHVVFVGSLASLHSENLWLLSVKKIMCFWMPFIPCKNSFHFVLFFTFLWCS